MSLTNLFLLISNVEIQNNQYKSGSFHHNERIYTNTIVIRHGDKMYIFDTSCFIKSDVKILKTFYSNSFSL